MSDYDNTVLIIDSKGDEFAPDTVSEHIKAFLKDPEYHCPIHGEVENWVSFMDADAEPEGAGPYCCDCVRELAMRELSVLKEEE